MMFDELIALAPPLPDFSAKFMGIYFEPMRDSGERLTIGVAAQAMNGETLVQQTLADKTLRCMYGDHALNMQGFIQDILSSAKQHLEHGYDLEDWRPPYRGVFMTKVHKTYSKTGLKGVIFQAVTLYSSLCKETWITETINEIKGIQGISEDPDQSIDTLIQELKVLTGTGYDGRWQRTINLHDAPLCIDYLGVKYNANLSNFDVKQLKGAFKLAKAKLFDLNVLRESRQNQVINEDQGFELLVSIKNRSHEALEQFYYLERHADQLALRVIAKQGADDIARHIKQREAA